MLSFRNLRGWPGLTPAVVGLIISLLAVAPAWPQAAADVSARRVAMAKEIAALKRKLDEAPDNEQWKRELDLLQKTYILFVQLSTATQQQADLQAQLARVREENDILQRTGLSERPPYSFLLLEETRDGQQAVAATLARSEETARLAEDALKIARTQFEERDSARRLAKEAADTNADPARQEELQSGLRLADLNGQLAEETRRLRELELANAGVKRELDALQAEMLRRKVELIRRQVTFSKQDLREVMVRLDKEELDIAGSLESAKLSLEPAENRWSEAKTRLDLAITVDPLLLQEVEALRMERQGAQQEINVLGVCLQRLMDRRTIWNERYRIFVRDVHEEDLFSWRDQAEKALEQLDREERLQTVQLAELRADAAILDGKLAQAEKKSAEIAPWLAKQRSELQKLERIYGINLTSQALLREQYRKLQDELGIQIQAPQTWREWLRSTVKRLSRVWQFELTTIDDSPITVGKIFSGLALLIAGIFASKLFAAWLRRRLIHRFHFNEGVGEAVQTLSFYALVVVCAVFALHLVHVPLTIFTLAGGALAIGVGFGSQNSVNNFLCGLVLLISRPVRIGDIVEVDGVFGRVEHIGSRCTRLITAENFQILIPNSSFLDTKVVNWTLSDDVVRCAVEVGVAYGTDTRRVAELLMLAAGEHSKILKAPAAEVIFSAFGESTLDFVLYFWIHMNHDTSRQGVQSDIRFRIDVMFREAGISIAFPQSDVHLDTARPLEVRVVQGAPAPERRDSPAPAARRLS